jgi:2-polyprenyl-3-methyl-5-hydroxy-6-metoxy-1,4-benzoquinol methylase
VSSIWREFFDSHASAYDQNPFTQHTEAEVDFLLNLYPQKPGATFIDIGCGTGRHSIELAKRGFQVSGIDISEGMLRVAQNKAISTGVSPKFYPGDAKTFSLSEMFDYAICLCEGGPGLIERGVDPVEHDKSIYQNIAKHLKPNAPFVLTCLNGYSVIRQLKDEVVNEGMFNPATMVSNYIDEWDLPDGKKEMQIYERLFIAPEVVRMLTESGFVVDAVYGGTAGYWARRPLSLDEVEAMFVCRRRP